MNLGFSPQSVMDIAYEYASERWIQLSNATHMHIEKASLLLQDGRIATLTLIAVNILFFEAALTLARCVHYILDKDRLYAELSPEESSNRCLGLCLLSIATITGENWFFCRLMNIPLPAWKVAVVIIPTNFLYLLIKTKF